MAHYPYQYGFASYADEPSPKQQMLAAVKSGSIATVGKMIKENPGLAYITDPKVSLERYMMHPHQPPLVMVAEDAGQGTLGRYISHFEATGIGSPISEPRPRKKP